jgi:hypothetical protein
VREDIDFRQITSWSSSAKKFAASEVSHCLASGNVLLPEKFHHLVSHGFRLLYTR